mgnify:CR=1 FL=1
MQAAVDRRTRDGATLAAADDITPERALALFAERHVGFLTSLDSESDDGLDDLHSLFGTVCALAELQAALGDRLRSDRPLQLVLDRRPFI